MHTVEDLDGIVIARGTALPNLPLTLTLTAPSGFTESNPPAYYPAESITLSHDACRALLSLLQRMVETSGEAA